MKGLGLLLGTTRKTHTVLFGQIKFSLAPNQLTHLEQDNEQLRERNDRLHAEVIDIKSRLGAIEEKARSELGLIKPGETFIRIIPQ